MLNTIKLIFVLSTTSWLILIQNVFCAPSYYDFEPTKIISQTDPNILVLTPHLNSQDTTHAQELSQVKLHGYENIRSYSGFFTVNPECNSNLFFWFFPAENNYHTAPLLLWLQGGPGSSGLCGVLTENGPFIIDGDQVKCSNYSWTIYHSVLYIDNPVGTGFSFTEKGCYAEDEYQIANELYEALMQFFRLFPELQKNDFFITGESYSGKYVPSLGHTIHKRNQDTEFKINLKGLILGDGYIDPINQGSKYGDFFYEIGLVDKKGRDRFRKLESQRAQAILDKNWKVATDIDRDMMNGEVGTTLFKNLTGFTDTNSFIRFQGDGPTFNDYVSDFVKNQDVRRSLHVGNTSFSVYSLKVFDCLRDDNMKSVAPLLGELLSFYRVLLYNGQSDLIVPYSGTEKFLDNLEFSGKDEYVNAEREIWRVNGEVAGYVREGGNLTEVLVRAAGHMAIQDKPQWIFDLVTRFTQVGKYS